MTQAGNGNTLCLGIDAGGTQTRWALARPSGEIVAQGTVAGFSALQMATEAGRAQVETALAVLAKDVAAAGRPVRVMAGVTGSSGSEALRASMAKQLGLREQDVDLRSDIEIAYLSVLAPGEGYLVYAGTGSFAAFVDADGTLHRVGGRGGILDDGGSGYWIAREALSLIWRREDEQPGSWRNSPMAVEIFDFIGGPEWPHTRHLVYESERGALGEIALAVAATAAMDPVSRSLLAAAGRELARLAQTLRSRFGQRPIVVTGRAFALHPLIGASMRSALPGESPVHRDAEAHVAAARIAAGKSAPAV
jgi:N-acetylglucosamine kinase-like BadF-type ATPase